MVGSLVFNLQEYNIHVGMFRREYRQLEILFITRKR
jgi:hypothetical protein